MLVLSRKLGEKIHIGNSIVITVVDIDRGKIRLGIEAPRDLPVYRAEVLTEPSQPKDWEPYISGDGFNGWRHKKTGKLSTEDPRPQPPPAA